MVVGTFVARHFLYVYSILDSFVKSDAEGSWSVNGVTSKSLVSLLTPIILHVYCDITGCLKTRII